MATSSEVKIDGVGRALININFPARSSGSIATPPHLLFFPSPVRLMPCRG